MRQRGKLVNVKVIDYTSKRTVEQEVRHIASILGRWAEIAPIQEGVIRKRVMGKSPNGLYETRSNAVVMWWEAIK